MLGLSCVTGVRRFYCLFPRRRGYVSPSPSPSLPPSLAPFPLLYSCLSQTPLLDIGFLHSLLFRLCVLFSTVGLLFLPMNPLLPCCSTRHPSPLCTLYSAHICSTRCLAGLFVLSLFDPWLAIPSDARKTQIQEKT